MDIYIVGAIGRLRLSNLLILLALLSTYRDGPGSKRASACASNIVTVTTSRDFRPVIRRRVSIFRKLFPLTKVIPHCIARISTIGLLLGSDLQLTVADHELAPRRVGSFGDQGFFPRRVGVTASKLTLVARLNGPSSLVDIGSVHHVLANSTGR